MLQMLKPHELLSRGCEDTGRQSGPTQHSLQEPAASYLNRWEREESSPSAASQAATAQRTQLYGENTGTRRSLGSEVLSLCNPTPAGIHCEQANAKSVSSCNRYILPPCRTHHNQIQFYPASPYRHSLCMRISYGIRSGFPSAVLSAITAAVSVVW